MNDRPLARVTFVLTHPVQYQAPWLRYITANAPELELTVLYGALPTPEQQGRGFGQAFTWDLPLTEGYRFEVCANASVRDLHSDVFFGLDAGDVGQRLAATRPDVVLIAGWHSLMQVRALWAARRIPVPVLYRGDSTLLSGPRSFMRPLWRLKTATMLRQFSGYLSVGQHATAYLRSFGVPADRIFRSPHCVDNDRFGEAALALAPRRQMLRNRLGIDGGAFVVFFVGKFQTGKRPLDAVRAVARMGGATLMMAGDGPLAAETRAEAERLGVRLIWRGFLNQSALPEAYAAADCVIMPSTCETWGLIVNEALASGLPCVVTDGVAAAPDLIVGGETGYVTTVGDIDAMSASLDALRRAKRDGRDFGPACRAQVDKCSFEAATRGLAAAVRQLLDGRRRPVTEAGTIHVA